MNPLLLRFCQAYGITDTTTFERLYETEEIVLFLPPDPTEAEKKALQELVGVEGVTYGFMDYVKCRLSKSEGVLGNFCPKRLRFLIFALTVVPRNARGWSACRLPT